VSPIAQETDFLLAATPPQWVETAVVRWRELLNDHAQCEKKAASTALALMFTYPEDHRLSLTLSRLAREELRHFEQVQKLMKALAVPFERQRPGRYAAGLRAELRSADPGRKLDLLLMGALIEARSCERFRLLAPRLPAEVAGFYDQLARSEARHFEQYLELARGVAEAHWQGRLRQLAECEARLATTPDVELRFHSGPPAGSVG
jgi:tRNA-(ms[2]io[6]A)-hydroxylase